MNPKLGKKREKGRKRKRINPADRKNFFSINRRYESTMKGSISEMGTAGIVYQEPTQKELNDFRVGLRKKKLRRLKNLC